MDSNTEWDPHFSSSNEVEGEMTLAARADLEYLNGDLNQKLRRIGEKLAEQRELNRSQGMRILQLNSEIETLRGQLQDLNLLDGFLRSGAVKALNLESDPTLKVLLTSFLARALQTALDTGAARLPVQRKVE